MPPPTGPRLSLELVPLDSWELGGVGEGGIPAPLDPYLNPTLLGTWIEDPFNPGTTFILMDSEPGIFPSTSFPSFFAPRGESIPIDLSRLSEERRLQFEERMGVCGSSSVPAENLETIIADLQANQRWTFQDVQNLVGPDGMRTLFGYGETIPFGFENEAQFRDFSRIVLRELYTAGVPLFDEAGRPNPEVRVVIQGSAVRGVDSREGRPYRWEAPRIEVPSNPLDPHFVRPSDVDVAVIVPPEVFSRFADDRRSEIHFVRVLPDGTQARTRIGRTFDRMLDQNRLDWFNLPSRFRDAVNRARDGFRAETGLERGVQVSFMPPDSAFVPVNAADQMVLSVETYLSPSDMVCSAEDPASRIFQGSETVPLSETAGPVLSTGPVLDIVSPSESADLGQAELETFIRDRYRELNNVRYDGIVSELAEVVLRAEGNESGRISPLRLAERMEAAVGAWTRHLEERSQRAVAEALRAEERERPRDRESLEREIRESMRRAAEIGSRR